MTYVKKVWAAGNNILSTDLQNIDDGIDNLFTKNISVSGYKTFQEISLIHDGSNAIKLQNSGSDSCDIYGDASTGIIFDDVIGKDFKFNNLYCKLVNGIDIFSHAAMHRKGGSSQIIREPTITVMPVGLGGDYNTLYDAVNAAVDGDYIHIGIGTYSEPTLVNINKKLTITGEGSYTHITGYIDITADDVRISNFRLTSTRLTDSAIIITGKRCIVQNMNVYVERYGLTINGDDNIIRNNSIEGLFQTSPSNGIISYKDNCIIKGNIINRFYNGVYLSCARNIVSNNYIVSTQRAFTLEGSCTRCNLINNIINNMGLALYMGVSTTKNIFNGCVLNAATFINNGTDNYIYDYVTA